MSPLEEGRRLLMAELYPLAVAVVVAALTLRGVVYLDKHRRGPGEK